MGQARQLFERADCLVLAPGHAGNESRFDPSPISPPSGVGLDHSRTYRGRDGEFSISANGIAGDPIAPMVNASSHLEDDYVLEVVNPKRFSTGNWPRSSSVRAPYLATTGLRSH